MDLFQLLAQGDPMEPRGMVPRPPMAPPTPQVPEPAPQFHEGLGSRFLAALGDTLGNVSVQHRGGASGLEIGALLAALAGGKALTRPAQERRALNQSMRQSGKGRIAGREAEALDDRKAARDFRYESALKRTEIAGRAAPKSLDDIRAEATARAEGTAAGTPYKPDRAQARFDAYMNSQKRNATGQLAGRYEDDSGLKGYEQSRRLVQQAETAATRNDGIGDLSLIFAYVRNNEPENINVVREGEVSTAAEAVGKLEKAKSALPQIMKGNRFTPEGRKRVVEYMKASLKTRRPGLDEANARFRREAEMFGTPTPFIRDYQEDFDPADLWEP